MKLRLDFVTNSSSSSYIIALEDTCKLSALRDENDNKIINTILGVAEKWIDNILRDGFDDDIGETEFQSPLVTEEDVKEHLEEHADVDQAFEDLLDEEPLYKNAYGAAIRALRAGKIVIPCKVGHHDSETSQALDALCAAGLLEILM